MTGTPLDGAAPERPGEELDRVRLAAYLRDALGFTGDPEVAQFAAGWSNLTYLVRVDGRELVLRRPPVGSTVKSAHDMGREHTVLERLQPHYPLTPRPLARCDDPQVLGFPFYVMERVAGVILRGTAPRGVTLDAPTARRVAEALIDAMARLHAVPWRDTPLAELGRPEGYAARQFRGWTERWRAARLDDAPELDAAAAWLLEHVPAGGDVAVVHNDFKHDNVVLDPDDLGRVRAVLDWEMATLGDPLLDLGTTLGYWTEAGDPPELRSLGLGPTALPGTPTRRELVALYGNASGRDPDALAAAVGVAYVFGLFKVAVIAAQIYVRFREGKTRDPRFAGLPVAIRALGREAERAIASGTL